MITLLFYLVVIGVVLFIVDKFILQPYTPPVVRSVFWVIVTLVLVAWLLNVLGLAHIALPKS